MNTSSSSCPRQTGFHPYRGRGRSRGNRGHRANTPGHRSNEGNYEHGDMRTGLFKPSFLEDPWKGLIEKRYATLPATDAGTISETGLMEGGFGNDEEIILPDDDDED